jgi:NAD(P)-dependent dehydrogenase (short-subunit alcohol dehydrogenase family)
MQAVIPGMRARGKGAIVNVSSGITLLTLPNNGPYSATKHALECLSLTARKELAWDDIRVSVVVPSLTDTPFEDGTVAFSDEAGLWSARPAPAGAVAGAAAGASAGTASGSEPEPGTGAFQPPPPDPPGLVAAKILEAIETGEAEVFAHERMRRR